jgi:hypothetical protein
MSALVPQQPNLRAFVVFDELPAGCIAFPIVNQDSDPLLRPGDVAVIDTNDRRADADLFLIEWGRSSPAGPRRVLIELYPKRGRYGVSAMEGSKWYAGAYARPRTAEAAVAAIIAGDKKCSTFVDGPYDLEGERNGDYLPSLLIGRVVGILEPRFAEPKRVAG